MGSWRDAYPSDGEFSDGSARRTCWTPEVSWVLGWGAKAAQRGGAAPTRGELFCSWRGVGVDFAGQWHAPATPGASGPRERPCIYLVGCPRPRNLVGRPGGFALPNA